MSLTVDIVAERDGFLLRAQASFDIGVTGIIGPNGCGKTTLLHCIAGLVPCEGKITNRNQSLTGLPPERRRLGVVFQRARLFPHLTVTQNLTYGAGGPVDDIVQLLDLQSLVKRMPSTLSGGERQRVAIGRALASRPEALLLDEPLTAVDNERKRALLAYLRRVAQTVEIPVLLVSHELRDVASLTDQVLVLDDGDVVGQGSLFDVLGDEASLSVVHKVGLASVTEVTDVRVAQGGTVRAMAGSCALVLPPTPDGVVDSGVGRVSVEPVDVILAMNPPGPTSARNVLKGTITRITPVAGRAIALVDVGWAASCPLMAEVTYSAVDEGLNVGVEVWCLVKATAFEWV